MIVLCFCYSVLSFSIDLDFQQHPIKLSFYQYIIN